MTTKVKLIWNKQTYDLEVQVDQPSQLLKAQIFALTGVPVDRQKLMFSGKLIKDDTNLQTLGIKEGAKLNMMGTAEAVPEGPKEKHVFLEDLPPSELAKQLPPSGLQNMGNTCYLNSCLQVIRQVTPWRTLLSSLPREGGAGNLSVELRDMLNGMDATPEPYMPLVFLMSLRRAFPQFDQKDGHGHHMQQDSEEAWTQIQTACVNAMSTSGKDADALERLFQVNIRTKLACVEQPDEPEVVQLESNRKLQCNVSTNSSTLELGLIESMAGKIEKRSDILGRDAVWQKESQLVGPLPEFLTVQLVRFYFRKDNNTKTKQLRAVQFPMTLDLAMVASPELKTQLEPGRAVLRARQLKEAEKARAKKQGVLAATSSSAGNAVPMDVDEEKNKDEEDLQALGNRTGFYELYGVITHKGRDADGGHYVAWVKHKGKWLMFDDDKVTEKDEDEVKKTAGGAGDWHLAYMLFYRTRNTEGYVCGPP